MTPTDFLVSPDVRHVDWWGLSLALATIVPIAVGIGWRWQLRRHWAHHPLRRRVQGHLADSLLAIGSVLGIATIAHVAGWPVWGAPLFGALALALLAVVAMVRQLVLASFAEQLSVYEEHYPAVAQADARLPRAKLPGEEIPVLAAFGAGIALYAVLAWHPWNHVFHMGLVPIGGLAGYALGSLIAARVGRVPPPGAVTPSHGRGRRKRGR